MRRVILIALLATGCSSSNSTGGAQGNVDFSFAGNTSAGNTEPANKPIAEGGDATIRARVHSATIATKATFDLQTPGVLSITGVSRGGAVGDWYVVVHAESAGTCRISVGDGLGKIIDTFDLTVAAIDKLEIPSSADVAVSQNKAIDVTARDAKGNQLYAPNAVAWSVDHPEIVQFWDAIRNTDQPATSGTTLSIHGLAVGSATLHGAYGKTLLSVPVTVK